MKVIECLSGIYIYKQVRSTATLALLRTESHYKWCGLRSVSVFVVHTIINYTSLWYWRGLVSQTCTHEALFLAPQQHGTTVAAKMSAAKQGYNKGGLI